MEKVKTKETKKQKKSSSYAVKAINNHMETLLEAGLVEIDDIETLAKIITRIKTKFLKEEYGI